MDRALADQQNVLRLEVVSFSFYMISNFAGDKDDDLVKIMIMPLKLPICTVIDMKQPEILLEIAGLCKGILRIVHGKPSWNKDSCDIGSVYRMTAFFAR